jgi:hypothetical protein
MIIILLIICFASLFYQRQNTIVAQGADHGDGHSGLKQQPTMKLMTLIYTIVLQIVALLHRCSLLSSLSF